MSWSTWSTKAATKIEDIALAQNREELCKGAAAEGLEKEVGDQFDAAYAALPGLIAALEGAPFSVSLSGHANKNHQLDGTCGETISVSVTAHPHFPEG